MSKVLQMKKKTPKNLNELIEGLATPNVSNQEIRELLLQFITEIPPDAGDLANRTKVKLEALTLLVKLNQLDQKQSGTADLVSIITEGEDDDE